MDDRIYISSVCNHDQRFDTRFDYRLRIAALFFLFHFDCIKSGQYFLLEKSVRIQCDEHGYSVYFGEILNVP